MIFSIHKQAQTHITGEEITTQDWCWVDADGNQVAHSDLDFRETVMPMFNE